MTGPLQLRFYSWTQAEVGAWGDHMPSVWGGILYTQALRQPLLRGFHCHSQQAGLTDTSPWPGPSRAGPRSDSTSYRHDRTGVGSCAPTSPREAQGWQATQRGEGLAQGGSAWRAVGLALGEGLNLLKQDLHRVYKSREQCLTDFRELNVLVYPAPTSSSRCSPRPGTLLCGLRIRGSGLAPRGRCGRSF